MKAKEIFETTTSGSIAAVSQPMTGGTLKRTTVGQGVYGKNKKAGNLLTGKKTKGKFVNSIGESATNSKEVVEADLHEESLKDIDAQISFHQEALGRGGKSSDSHHREVLKKLFKKRKEVNKDKLDEDDLILVPGQGHRLKTGFIPHSSDRRDHEVEMAKSDLFQAAKHAKTIYELIKDVSEDDGLPGWVQEKIIKANDYLTAVSEYLEHKGSVAEGSEKPDMREQILAGIRQGKKQNNATKIFYYSWLLIKGMLASASYEKFINSWAGEKWFEKHKSEIEKFAREEKARSQKDYKIEAPKALAEMTGGVVAGGGVGEGVSEEAGKVTQAQAFTVHIPANVYAGKYYDYRTYPYKVYIGYDGVETEQDAIDWVNSHKDQVLDELNRAKRKVGVNTRRSVAHPIDKNVFFKNTYVVRGPVKVEFMPGFNKSNIKGN